MCGWVGGEGRCARARCGTAPQDCTLFKPRQRQRRSRLRLRTTSSPVSTFATHLRFKLSAIRRRGRRCEGGGVALYGTIFRVTYLYQIALVAPHPTPPHPIPRGLWDPLFSHKPYHEPSADITSNTTQTTPHKRREKIFCSVGSNTPFAMDPAVRRGNASPSEDLTLVSYPNACFGRGYFTERYFAKR